MLVPFRPNEATREAPQSSGTRIPSSYRESVENRSRIGRSQGVVRSQHSCSGSAPPPPLGLPWGSQRSSLNCFSEDFQQDFQAEVRSGEERTSSSGAAREA